MPHCIYQPDTSAQTGEIITVSGPEAHHAIRVKRLEQGDPVHLLSGTGERAACVIDAIRKPRGEWEISLRVDHVVREPRLSPQVLVRSGVPKGDALEQMIDGLSQVGAAAWSPLRSARTVVDPRDAKLTRLHRVCEESLKQCSRAWLMDIREGVTLDAALQSPHSTLVIADASGTPYTAASDEVTLLIGPEGGFAPEELAAARAAGARVCTFGFHVMRIEVAAVVATAHIIAAHHNRRA
ncbi:MAG TPA: RsmE family RNA methyltransferase [Phycisphaerales bacterium]|nr:RsmE family RNA methyltransferase [Phycisphaerales bacterium]